MTNPHLRHLLPTPPGAEPMSLMAVAEDWEEYATAVEAILVAFPTLRDDVVAPTVARTRAREARARGEVRTNQAGRLAPSASAAGPVDEGDPGKDRRQPPNPAPDVAPSESLLMQPPRL